MPEEQPVMNHTADGGREYGAIFFSMLGVSVVVVVNDG